MNGARARIPEIAALFEKELGRPVEVTLREPQEPGAEAPDQPAPGVAAANPESADPLDDPLVKTVIELFSARIVSVQPRTVNPG